MAMGNAMTGLSQGYDATYFNPAGLAQSHESEFTTGLNFLGYNDNANYLGNGNSLSSSQTDLSSLGLVYAFPTTKGSLVIALGYNRGADYNSALSTSTGSGYNPNTSIIPSYYSPYDTLDDIPYMLYLEGVQGDPLVTNNVKQSGKTFISGGLNQWTASLGTDIAYNFSLGLTLTLVSGSYNYTRTFTETGIAQGGDYGGSNFSSIVLDDQQTQDINGWNAKAGFMYRMAGDDGNTVGRIGVTITFPTFASIVYNYSTNGTAYYTGGYAPLSYSASNGYGADDPLYPGSALRYDVTTPFKFEIGGSGNISQLLLSGDLEYVDWTEMRFSNSNLPASDNTISDLNSEIKQEFRSTLNLRVGAELALANPDYSLLVPYIRAGAQYLPSPYSDATSAMAQKYISGGVGVKIQNAINLDLAYQYGWWTTTTLVYGSTNINDVIYGSASTSSEKVTNTNFMFTFSYDF